MVKTSLTHVMYKQQWFKMVQNGSEGFTRVQQEKGSKGFKRVQKGSKRFKKVQKGSKGFKKAHKGSTGFKRVQKGSKRFKKFQKGSNMFKRAPNPLALTLSPAHLDPVTYVLRSSSLPLPSWLLCADNTAVRIRG